MYTIIKHTRKPATIEDLLAVKKRLDAQPIEITEEQKAHDKELVILFDSIITKCRAKK